MSFCTQDSQSQGNLRKFSPCNSFFNRNHQGENQLASCILDNFIFVALNHNCLLKTIIYIRKKLFLCVQKSRNSFFLHFSGSNASPAPSNISFIAHAIVKTLGLTNTRLDGGILGTTVFNAVLGRTPMDFAVLGLALVDANGMPLGISLFSNTILQVLRRFKTGFDVRILGAFVFHIVLGSILSLTLRWPHAHADVTPFGISVITGAVIKALWL